MKRLTAWSALLFCLFFWQLSAQAIEQIDIRIEQWATEQLAAEGFDLALGLTPSGIQLNATAKTLRLPAPINIIKEVQLSCDKTQWLASQLRCESGQLRFNHAQLGQQKLSFSLTALPDAAHYIFDVSGLKLAGSDMSVAATITASDWNVRVDATGLHLEKIAPWLPLWLDETQLTTLSNWNYHGQLDIKATLHGTDSHVQQLAASWTLAELNFSNDSGTQVAELLTGQGDVSGEKTNNGWQWQSAIHLDGGQSYVDPVFIDFQANPTKLTTTGYISSDLAVLDVPDMTIEQSGLLTADVQLALRNKTLSKLNITLQQADFESFYAVWLQPFTLGTAVDKLTPSGKIAATFEWQDEQYLFDIAMDNVSIDDQNQRFQIEAVNGHLGWSSSEQPASSDVQWQKAQIYAIDLGQAAIKAQSKNNGLKLTEQVSLPILDGRLLINAFSLKQRSDQHVDWTFDGLLTPISMERLSDALQWPRLHGKLSGVIPNVSYKQQQLKIDGALQMKVFDGTTVIRDLRMTTPLGALPQLYANIDITDLDLELLTRTFDVGRITGKLTGYVHDLRLSNWQPVQFKARLATPENNPGKRRISQKAVDNLTQIGGGAGLISRSFLRFFDDFSYQKLGLSCTLTNETCDMAGIEEAEQGYYIVKGGGGLPPWINVVGYTRRVDWSELIERLKAVQDSSGPVIQ